MNGQKVQVTFQDVPEQIQVIQGQGVPLRDTSVQLNPGEKLYHQPGSEVRYRSAGGDERWRPAADCVCDAASDQPAAGGAVRSIFLRSKSRSSSSAGPALPRGRRRPAPLAVVLAVLAQAAPVVVQNGIIQPQPGNENAAAAALARAIGGEQFHGAEAAAAAGGDGGGRLPPGFQMVGGGLPGGLPQAIQFGQTVFRCLVLTASGCSDLWTQRPTDCEWTEFGRRSRT